MLSLFNEKGGAVGQRIKSHILELIQDPSASVERRTDMLLRCLMEYMGERQEEMISDHQFDDEMEVRAKLSTFQMKIYVCNQPKLISIITERHPVIRGLIDLSRACCLLFGLIYVLDLKHPPKPV